MAWDKAVPARVWALVAISLLPLLVFVARPFLQRAPRTFTNSIGMKFVWIEPGEFWMGSPEGEEGRSPNETRHNVRITRGGYLGATEVTQKEWRAIMGTSVAEQRNKANPPRPLAGEGDEYPMYYVSWDEAAEFCRRLGRKEGKVYRLPTEAEWEYACRAGTTTPFNTGATISTDEANYNGNYTYGSAKKGACWEKTTAVGSFRANAWGLYDMHGNVWEWCSDWYGEYVSGEATDPKGPANGDFRVLRGGCWTYDPRYCRSAYRGWCAPDIRDDVPGFRVALDP